MAEYTAIEEQTIAPNGVALFTETTVPSGRIIYHRGGSGVFSLRGFAPVCQGYAKFKVHFGGNIAVPTGGTPGEISLALAIGGEPEASTIMTVTPAAVGEYFNIARDITVKVPAGCCANISVENVSGADVLLRNAVIDIDWEA